MLTVAEMCFSPASECCIFFFPIPAYILTSEVSFMCTFLPCQGVSKQEQREEGSFSLSQPRGESIASPPLHSPSPLPHLPPPPLLGLWSVRLCCLFGRCGCEGNTEWYVGTSLPSLHRNMLIKHQTWPTQQELNCNHHRCHDLSISTNVVMLTQLAISKSHLWVEYFLYHNVHYALVLSKHCHTVVTPLKLGTWKIGS